MPRKAMPVSMFEGDLTISGPVYRILAIPGSKVETAVLLLLLFVMLKLTQRDKIIVVNLIP